jgi:hypothetical protein
MKAKSGFPLRLLDIAMEKVNPAFLSANLTALGKDVLGN